MGGLLKDLTQTKAIFSESCQCRCRETQQHRGQYPCLEEVTV